MLDLLKLEYKNKSPKGQRSLTWEPVCPERLFFLNNLGQDIQNKYAQGQVTPK